MNYLVILLIFASTVLGTSTTWAGQNFKLGLNWKAEPQFGGFFEAQRAGYFTEEKINLEIIEGGSGTPTIQMLANNQLDFAIVSADELLLAREKGALLVALFAVYQTNPQAIMTHPENNFSDIFSVFKTPGTISLQAGLPYAQFIQKKIGKDIKAKLVPYTGGIGLFLKDKTLSQQCFFTSEPILAEAQNIKPKVFLVADSGYNPYTTVVAVKKSLLDKDPKAVKAAIAAIRKGWTSYLNSPEATNTMMAKMNLGMDLATFKRSADLQKPLIETDFTKAHGLGYMDLKRWDELKKQLAELKILKSSKSDTKSIFVNL